MPHSSAIGTSRGFPMTARRIGGSIRHGSSPFEGIDFDRIHGEAITLTGTRVGWSRLMRWWTWLADRAAVLRACHRVNTRDFRTIQARPKDRLTFAPAGS